MLAYSYFINNGKFETDSDKAYGQKLNREFKRMGIGAARKK